MRSILTVIVVVLMVLAVILTPVAIKYGKCRWVNPDHPIACMLLSK